MLLINYCFVRSTKVLINCLYIFIGTVIIYDPIYNYEGFSVSEWLLTTDPELFGLVAGYANPTGVLLIIILFVMFICSQPFVRRGGCFEVRHYNNMDSITLFFFYKISNVIRLRFFSDILLDSFIICSFLLTLDPSLPKLLEMVDNSGTVVSVRTFLPFLVDAFWTRKNVHQFWSTSPVQSHSLGYKKTTTFWFSPWWLCVCQHTGNS